MIGRTSPAESRSPPVGQISRIKSRTAAPISPRRTGLAILRDEHEVVMPRIHRMGGSPILLHARRSYRRSLKARVSPILEGTLRLLWGQCPLEPTAHSSSKHHRAPSAIERSAPTTRVAESLLSRHAVSAGCHAGSDDLWFRGCHGERLVAPVAAPGAGQAVRRIAAGCDGQRVRLAPVIFRRPSLGYQTEAA